MFSEVGETGGGRVPLEGGSPFTRENKEGLSVEAAAEGSSE